MPTHESEIERQDNNFSDKELEIIANPPSRLSSDYEKLNARERHIAEIARARQRYCALRKELGMPYLSEPIHLTLPELRTDNDNKFVFKGMKLVLESKENISSSPSRRRPKPHINPSPASLHAQPRILLRDSHGRFISNKQGIASQRQSRVLPRLRKRIGEISRSIRSSTSPKTGLLHR